MVHLRNRFQEFTKQTEKHHSPKSKISIKEVVSVFCHEALGSSCVCTRFLLVSLAGMANARLTPFEIGQIKAHVYHGLKGAAISRVLKKPDGKSF